MRRLALLALVLSLCAGCLGSNNQGLANEGGGPQRNVPSWVKQENLPPNAVPGAALFAVAGCTACHTYDGSGKQLLHAPDLTAIGTLGLGVTVEIEHLKCPSCVNPGSPMPAFATLGRKRLRQLAIFLEASKGTH
jgi:mono/diheme cytochrome c family protein